MMCSLFNRPAIKDREYVAMDVTVGAFHLSSGYY